VVLDDGGRSDKGHTGSAVSEVVFEFPLSGRMFSSEAVLLEARFMA